ncbi:MAG: YHS domain-containing protein, partial [Bryobacteraceae bacterium]
MDSNPTGPFIQIGGAPASRPTARDPVCGMLVDPACSSVQFDYQGVTYQFCCTHCLEKFRAAPESYLE